MSIETPDRAHGSERLPEGEGERADGTGDDGFARTGRRKEFGLLTRLKHWLR